MLKYFGLIFIFFTAFLFGCEDKKVKEREQLFSEVMEVHDEMMMMGKIRGAQNKLKGMMEKASAKADSASIKKYETAHQQLQIADDEMMGWMKQFKNPSKETNHDEAIKYLKDQKVKVQKMKDIMVENMDKAREVIEF